MDISPNDIRKYQFPSQLRGYDKDDVDSFKERIADSLEKLKQENLKLSMELESVKSQLQGLRQFEDTIKGAAIDARRNADQTIANAKKEAAEALRRAKEEAQKLVFGHRGQMAALEQQVHQLQTAKNSYLTKLKELISNHLSLVDEIAREELFEQQAQKARAAIAAAKAHDARQAKENGLEITESQEVDAKHRETVATLPSKPIGIKTEEANAAEEIVAAEKPAETDFSQQAIESDQAPGEFESAVPDLDEAIRGDVAGERRKEIDPELAAALESYKKGVEKEGTIAPLPPQHEMAKTAARAEDLPSEFAKVPVQPTRHDKDMRIVADGDIGEEADEEKNTDKVHTAPEVQDQPTEHNTIDIDTAEHEQRQESGVDPDNLAEELDKVVAKFEEEMDKAARS